MNEARFSEETTGFPSTVPSRISTPPTNSRSGFSMTMFAIMVPILPNAPQMMTLVIPGKHLAKYC